jgi:hypothetical protein
LEVIHEARQVLEVMPELGELLGRTIHRDALLYANGAVPRETSLRCAGTVAELLTAAQIQRHDAAHRRCGRRDLGRDEGLSN